MYQLNDLAWENQAGDIPGLCAQFTRRHCHVYGTRELNFTATGQNDFALAPRDVKMGDKGRRGCGACKCAKQDKCFLS